MVFARMLVPGRREASLVKWELTPVDFDGEGYDLATVVLEYENVMGDRVKDLRLCRFDRIYGAEPNESAMVNDARWSAIDHLSGNASPSASGGACCNSHSASKLAAEAK